jgi:hypothetical protein
MTTQFTETETESTLVVKSSRRILSGTVTVISTRSTTIQTTEYQCKLVTSTARATKYFPATRTIFSTQVYTISLTLTAGFTATDLISMNAGAGVKPAAFEFSLTGFFAGMALVLIPLAVL